MFITSRDIFICFGAWICELWAQVEFENFYAFYGFNLERERERERAIIYVNLNLEKLILFQVLKSLDFQAFASILWHDSTDPMTRVMP